MKIPLKRFKHQAEMVKVTSHQLFNGSFASKTTVLFRFMYANLHESINAQLSDLGTKTNTTFMIVSMDPRFKTYVDNPGSDHIKIGSVTYRISNVTLDDSDIVPVYQITISKDTNASSSPSSSASSTPKKRLPWQRDDDDDGDDDY